MQWEFGNCVNRQSAKKVHNRDRLIAMIEQLKPRKPIFKSEFQTLVNYSVTNYDSLKIHTETIISKIPIFIQSCRKILRLLSDKA